MIDPHGYEAGKKIKGKKRNILGGTQGLLMHALGIPETCLNSSDGDKAIQSVMKFSDIL